MGLADVVIVGAGGIAVEAGAAVAGEVAAEELSLSLGGTVWIKLKVWLDDDDDMALELLLIC